MDVFQQPARAYHRSGDEFLGAHDDPAVLEAAAKEANRRLKSATFEVTAPDGRVISSTGVQFSYGIGLNAQEAEAGLQEQKDEKLKTGERRRRHDDRATPGRDSDRVGSEGDQALDARGKEAGEDSGRDARGPQEVTIPDSAPTRDRGDEPPESTPSEGVGRPGMLLPVKFIEALAEYGFSAVDRALVTPSGKKTSSVISVKGGHVTISGKDGHKAWSGSPENVGLFLERFWGAKKLNEQGEGSPQPEPQDEVSSQDESLLSDELANAKKRMLRISREHGEDSTQYRAARARLRAMRANIFDAELNLAAAIRGDSNAIDRIEEAGFGLTAEDLRKRQSKARKDDSKKAPQYDEQYEGNEEASFALGRADFAEGKPRSLPSVIDPTDEVASSAWYRGYDDAASAPRAPKAAPAPRAPRAPKAPRKPKKAPKAPVVPPQEADSNYGKNNKFVTPEQHAENVRKLLQLGRNLHSGLSPEMVGLGTQIALYHIEAGSRKFADFATAVLADLGDAFMPYLRSFYEAARHYPGFDTTGMTPYEETGRLHDAMMAEDDSEQEAKGGVESDETQESEATQDEDQGGENQPGVPEVDRGGIPDSEGKRGQHHTQQGASPRDTGNVGTDKPEVSGGVEARDDGKQDGIRPSRKDVAGAEEAGKRGDAVAGLPGASGKDVPDAGPGGPGTTGERRPGSRGTDTDSNRDGGAQKGGEVVDPKSVSPANPGAGNYHIDDPMRVVGGSIPALAGET